jgi:hypothetical protein
MEIRRLAWHSSADIELIDLVNRQEFKNLNSFA